MSTAIPSTYTQEFALPEALPQVLKDLTREILRANPADIDVFAREFFENRLKHDHNQPQVTDTLVTEIEEVKLQLSEMTPAEIEDMIHGLFKEQDVDGNRTLDRHEFKQVFHKLGARLGLKTNDVRRILAEADCDGNGEISYAEFIPVAVSIIETIVAKEKLKESEQEKERVMHDAEQHIYHGMPPAELDEILTSIFKEADVDGSGALDLDEFERCLCDIRIGMTRKEVNLLMFETYSNDGMIDYEAFKPLCMKLLVELTAQEWLAPDQDEADLEGLITKLCLERDAEHIGKLHIDSIQEVLVSADLGMSLVQICSILSEAQEDEDSMVDYVAFAPRVAFMVHACQNYRERMNEKKEIMQNLHAGEGWGVVFGRDRDTLEAELQAAFEALDKAGSGCLTKLQIKDGIKAVFADTIDRKATTALLALAKTTESGMYQYKTLVEQAFRTLKGIVELSILYED
eukprot:CAMPEP_0202046100 /NCGR_PEP_ID=MMETSP0963-20130614/1090_1 /ASSEMBLY_ACC=CAM_ASM_000494 /TAXON_ID=4773 /ORGANISM="Schizochytrium aggregatum, Strain ATCC28209" /LENGTH=459 /DNA_ID=CAMNT_0048610727 /DNA_START=42 /DNA_END=1421 /DNA_ORIENTATION=+